MDVETRPQPSKEAFLIFLFLFIILTPNSPPVLLPDATEGFVKEGRANLDLLHNSTSQEQFFPKEFDQAYFHQIQDEALRATRTDSVWYHYENLTASLKGSWAVGPKLRSSSPAMDFEAFQNLANQSTGSVSLELEERPLEDSSEITLDISLKDTSRFSFARHVYLSGSFQKENGSIIATTGFEQYGGRVVLPGFALDTNEFESSRLYAERVLSKEIDDVENHRTIPRVFGNLTEDRCQFVCYLRSDPIDQHDRESLRFIEQELHRSSGALLPDIPDAKVSGILFSPNCGVSFSFSDLKGPKIEKYFRDLGTFAAFQITVVLLELLFHVRQMRNVATPSIASRISFWTIAIQAYHDGCLSLFFFNVAIMNGDLFIPYMSLAFLTFILATLFSLRFLLLIVRAQQTEGSSVNQNPRGQAANAPPAEGQRTTPALTTPATPAAAGGGGSFMGSVYGRFYLALIATMFILFQVTLLPLSLKKHMLNIAMFLAMSMWIPQIVRNTRRGSCRAFTWSYIIATTALRMSSFCYVYANSKHLLLAPLDIRVALLCCVWAWFQLVILGIQEFLGPRFLVPEKWLNPIYDYHPILNGDLESGDSSMQVQNSDCAICMGDIDFPSYDTRTHPTSILARRAYMVTPCRHVFHSRCLESWMNFRLVCPVCRHPLPAI